MNYLITGGSGFLGFHLIQQLLKDKQKITVLDIVHLPEKNLLKKLTFINGDVRNPTDVKKATQGVDIVIHCAAALPLESTETIRTTTIDGTRNILEAAFGKLTQPNPLFKKERASPSYSKREPGGVNGVTSVIYVSSTAVYGVPEKHPIFETDPLVGVGPYGHAKIAAEALCEQYRAAGFCVPIVRPKTFVGTQRLGIFQILCNWVREGHRIPIIGNGHNRYQLLDVTDLVDAIILLSTLPTQLTPHTPSVNSTYNVGSETFGTVRSDVTALCDYAGSGSTVLPVPSILVKPVLRTLEAINLSPLYRWVYDTADKDSYVSIDKLKSLGWQPKFSNAQALINMYKWYMKHYQEFEHQSGTTHRVGWSQGALGLIKKFL